MKKFIYILIFFLISCYNNEENIPITIGPEKTVQYISLYDSVFENINDSICHIVGKVGDVYLNRKCTIFSNGYIQFGTSKVLLTGRYFVHLDVFLCDTLYYNIHEFKDIEVNEILYK